MKDPVEAPSPFMVVVGDDFGDSSLGSSYAFEQAARVARRIPDSQLHVVSVIEGASTSKGTHRIADQLQRYIDDVARAIGGLEQQRIGVHVRCGKASDELSQFARDVNADLVVVGAHGARLSAPCPVFETGPMPRPDHAVREATIAPPCAACLAVRAQTAGAAFWCSRHAEHHAQAHSYSFRRELPFRTHDAAVTPTGVD